MISSKVVASDSSTGQRITAQSPKTYHFCLYFSPGFSFILSSSTMISCPFRFTTGLGFAKYKETIGMFSRLIYCRYLFLSSLIAGTPGYFLPVLFWYYIASTFPVSDSSDPMRGSHCGKKRFVLSPLIFLHPAFRRRKPR